MPGVSLRTRTQRFTSLMAIALIALGGYAGQASASCNPGRSSGVIGFWFDGWKRPASNVPNGNIGDTYSRILEASPYVESASYDTTAWVMLTNASGGYAQIGWYKVPGGSRNVFMEVTDQNGIYHRSLGAPYPVGNFTPYEVWWDAGNQRFDFFAQNMLFGTAIRYFTIKEAQQAAETHTLDSQMPEGTNSYEEFTFSTVSNLAGSTYNFDGASGGLATVQLTNATIHDAVRASTHTRIDTWDKACTN